MSDIKEATQDFNPRLREGGDENAAEVEKGIKISIHASAKEATKSFMAAADVADFNPRLREGGDRNIL